MERESRATSEPDAHVAAALRIELEAWRRALAEGAERVGWKIALGIGEVEERIDAQPVIGYLTTGTRLASGGAHSAAGAAELCVDAELAVEIGRDGAIAGYAAALELVDLGQARGTVESVVRANVLHRAFVLGPTRADPVRRARVYVDGVLRKEGVADFDLDARLDAVRYWLTALDENLEPGDRVITGSIVQVPVEPGDEVVVDMAELGRLETRITA
jgi:2-keto-4-pentenoate hydratase